MLIEKIGYSYNDVTLVPEIISNISSRSNCNPFIKDKFLPIFTAPMASVVNFENYETFLDNGITPIIPRNISLEVRKDLMNDQQWVALSLKEFEDLFINNYLDRIGDFRTHYFICVDIANGHMKSLYDKCIKAKNLAKDNNYKLTIMTGNIANAKTYEWIYKNALYEFEENGHKYYDCAIDYIRVGIGGGSGCITTSNVSIHYPQASLINECKKIKESVVCNRDLRKKPAIVADGGIRNYDHVIKALALGADYVMIGSLFAQCIESAGDKFDITDNYFHYNNWNDQSLRINGKDEWYGIYKLLRNEKFIGELKVKFFGMASADGQKSISGEKTKTAEGITKWLPVKYTLKGWTENMISYLRSAMSYTDCTTLNEFIGKPSLIINSISEINAVNK